MDMQDFANLGSAVLTGNPQYVVGLDKDALHARNQSEEMRRLVAYAVPTPENLHTRIDGRTIVGWTTPTLTYDKQRQINASALSLNFDIERNVKRVEFKSAWNKWFQTWQTFFTKYQSDSGKTGALLDTDGVAAQTESFRVQLQDWIAAYERENVGPTTAPSVPKVTPPAPGEEEKKPGEGLPWWLIGLFVVGGVGFVAGSFFIIRRKVIEAKEAEHFIKRDVLPIVLGSAMGPTGVAFAHAATNRFAGPENDPSGMGGPPLY